MKRKFAILRPIGAQRGVLYFSIALLVALSLILGAFLWERIALFSAPPTSFMNPSEFYATFALDVAVLLALLVLIHRNFRIPIAWGWLFLFLLLAIGNAIGTFMFGTHFTGSGIFARKPYSYDLTFTMAQRVRFVLCFSLACVYFYLVFAVFPKAFPHTRWIRLACWIVMGLVVAAIVYSALNEQRYFEILVDPNGNIDSGWFRSFTNNENTYGFILFLGIVLLCFIHNARSRFIYWVLILSLGLYQIIVLSATSIVCTWLFILLYAIYRYALSVRHKPVRSTITLLLFIIGVIALTVMIFADAFGPGSVFAKIHRQIDLYFSGRSTTFVTRVDTWNVIIKAFTNPISWIFGAGDFQSRIYLSVFHGATGEVLDVYPAHNGWMQMIIDGGFLRLGVYAIVLIRVLYVAIARTGRRSKIAWPILFGIIAMSLHGFMESTSFLCMDTKGFSLLLFLVLPIEIEHFQAKHPAVVGYVASFKTNCPKTRFGYEYTPMRMAKISLYFLALLFVLTVGVGAIFFHMGYGRVEDDWSFYVLFGLVLMCAPFGYYALGFARKKKRAVRWFTLGLILLLGSAAAAMWFNPLITRIGCAVVFLYALFPVWFHPKDVFHGLDDLLRQAFLPYLLIVNIICIADFMGFLIPEAEFSPHIIIAMTAGTLFLYFTLIALPKKAKLAYPFAEKWSHFDARVVSISLKREDKRDRKQVKHLDPTYEPPRQKRIYAYRP